MRTKRGRPRSKPTTKSKKKVSKPNNFKTFTRFKAPYKKCPWSSLMWKSPRNQKPNAKIPRKKGDQALQQQVMMCEDNSPSTFKGVILREMERQGRQPSEDFKRAAESGMSHPTTNSSNMSWEKIGAFADFMSSQKPRNPKTTSPKQHKLIKKRKELMEKVELMKNEDTMLENGQEIKKVILREMNRMGRQPSIKLKKIPNAVTKKYLPRSLRPWAAQSSKAEHSKLTKRNTLKKIDPKTISLSVAAKDSESSILTLMSSPLDLGRSNPKKASAGKVRNSTHDLFQRQHREELTAKEELQCLEAETMMETEVDGQDMKEIIFREMNRLGREPSEENLIADETAAAKDSESSILTLMSSPLALDRSNPKKASAGKVRHSTHDLFQQQHREELTAKEELQYLEAETMMETEVDGQDMKEILFREMNRLGREPSEENLIADETVAANDSESSILTLMSSPLAVDRSDQKKETMMETEVDGQDMNEIIFREMNRLGREPSEQNQIADETAISQNMEFAQNSRPFGWSYLKEFPPNVISKKPQSIEEVFPISDGPSMLNPEMADQTAMTSNMEFSQNSRPFGWTYLKQSPPNAFSTKPQRDEQEDKLSDNAEDEHHSKEVIDGEMMDRPGRQTGEDFKWDTAKSLEPSGKSIQFTIPGQNIISQNVSERHRISQVAWPTLSLTKPHLCFQQGVNKSMSLPEFSPNTSPSVIDPTSLGNQEQILPEEQIQDVLASLCETGIEHHTHDAHDQVMEEFKDFFKGLVEALLRSKGTRDKYFQP